MASENRPPLSQALEQLWLKFHPVMMERAGVLEAANRAAADGTLTAEQRQQAVSAAHKLAGVLGTFGLSSGTELAREAETLYGQEVSNQTSSLLRLQQIVEQLKALIEQRT